VRDQWSVFSNRLSVRAILTDYFELITDYFFEFSRLSLSKRRPAGGMVWQLRTDVGDHTAGVTPVPIPNTEVKPRRADCTARETVWESRSSPALIKAQLRNQLSLFRFGNKSSVVSPQNFKPKDPISIAYYTTQFPKRADEVNAFVDRFVKGIPPEDSVRSELEKLRQVLLATYGKEPKDPAVRAFASEQRWYAPRKDFSMNDPKLEQQAVLESLSKRIAATR
jgi:hypothetical protein